MNSGDSILNVNSRINYDENIIRNETHSYGPYTNISLDSTDNINISINQESSYLLVSESGIYIEGKIVKDDGSSLEANKQISFVKNGLCFLFDEIRLEMNSIEIDSCKNVGITSTLKAYPSYSSDEIKKYETTGQSVELSAKYTFSGYLPLKFLFGFAENYEKIILNQRLDLILMRSKSTKDALLSSGTDAVTDAKVQLSKVLWKVPHVQVSDPIRLELLSQYKKNIPIDMSFRRWNLNYYPNLPASKEINWTVKTSNQMEKPRYIILGFQTDRDNNLKKDPSEFDNVKLKNMKVYLNSICFPYESLNIDFDSKMYIPLYLMYCAFQESYFGKISEPYLSYKDYLSKAPIIVIDCSKQSELWKHSSTVDIRVEYELAANVPEKTTLYALIIHDSLVRVYPLTNTIQKIL